MDDKTGCHDIFVKHPGAKCILYDDEACGDKDWRIDLLNGERQTFSSESKYANNAESVSIQKGCQLQVWKGMV